MLKYQIYQSKLKSAALPHKYPSAQWTLSVYVLVRNAQKYTGIFQE